MKGDRQAREVYEHFRKDKADWDALPEVGKANWRKIAETIAAWPDEDEG